MSVTCAIDNIMFLSPGVVALDWSQFRDRYKGQLWAECKSRKITTCNLTGLPIKVGDKIFRPVGNTQNRMKRILAQELIREAKNQAARSKP